MNKENVNIEDIIISYLDGMINQAESEELLAWLEASDDNRKIFLDYYNIWGYSENIKFDEKKALSKFISQIGGEDNLKEQTHHRKISIYKYLGIAAACIIALFIAIPSVMQYFSEDKDDIVAFANKTSNVNMAHTQTQLVLSDNKAILLDEKEANIQYESESIKVNEENTISKQESAVYNQLIIPYGKRSTITFSDGTKAWVNSGTRLVYPVEFKKEQREVFVDGEIYIEVAEDKSRPFIVKTSDVDIKVLGTKFNVSAYESDKTKNVVLVSGSVKVSAKSSNKDDVLLSPNQMYSVTNGVAGVKNVDVNKYIMWIDGLYYFESAKLGDILNRLSRYYGKIIIYDNTVAELRCTGKLDMKDEMQEILQGLTHTVPISYKQNVDGVHVITLNHK